MAPNGTAGPDDGPVYALNLFDLADQEEYLAYSRRSAREVAAHGGRVVALGRFRESVAGEVAPRQVLILVEWQSRAAFESYRDDPALADLHPHRENGTSGYVWQLFDRLDDLRGLLLSQPHRTASDQPPGGNLSHGDHQGGTSL